MTQRDSHRPLMHPGSQHAASEASIRFETKLFGKTSPSSAVSALSIFRKLIKGFIPSSLICFRDDSLLGKILISRQTSLHQAVLPTYPTPCPPQSASNELWMRSIVDNFLRLFFNYRPSTDPYDPAGQRSCPAFGGHSFESSFGSRDGQRVGPPRQG